MSDQKWQKRAPHLIDKQIGHKIKHFRLLKGWSQEKLGTAIGVTFQQLQKYELGTNRISISRLVAVGTALGLPVHVFVNLEAAPSHPEEPLQKDILQLVAAYSSIGDAGHRRRLLSMAQALAEAEEAHPGVQER